MFYETPFDRFLMRAALFMLLAPVALWAFSGLVQLFQVVFYG